VRKKTNQWGPRSRSQSTVACRLLYRKTYQWKLHSISAVPLSCNIRLSLPCNRQCPTVCLVWRVTSERALAKESREVSGKMFGSDPAQPAAVLAVPLKSTGYSSGLMCTWCSLTDSCPVTQKDPTVY